MKKTFLLSSLIMFCFFTSCSKDDDKKEENSVDSFIGKWILSEEFDDDEVYELTECDKKTYYIFNSNNTLMFTETYTINEDPECIENSINGTWVDKGNNNYDFIFDDEGTEVIEKFNLTFTKTTLTLVDLREGFGYTEVYIKAN